MPIISPQTRQAATMTIINQVVELLDPGLYSNEINRQSQVDIQRRQQINSAIDNMLTTLGNQIIQDAAPSNVPLGPANSMLFGHSTPPPNPDEDSTDDSGTGAV